MLNHAKRTSRRSRTLSMYLAAGTAALAMAAAPAAAGPEGETVVFGDVTFVRDGDVWTVYVGDLAIIEYSNFDIAPHEMVQFIQPGADSRVLNRILSGAPTNIEGTLLANGQLYLVNPSGVIFGKNSVVNAGALYAAAGNISNQDFLAGVNRFTNTGAVANFGTIEGDLVSLVGSTVANHGAIRAREGTVVMAAGEQVVIGEQFGSLYVKIDGPSGEIDVTPHGGPALASGDVFSLAAWNNGTIEARNAHIESTGATLVTGSIDATGSVGGNISILGEVVELQGATIDASGTNGGGAVVIGGPERGEGDTRSAMYTIIDSDSSVHADALVAGDGGSVVVWSDDATAVDGELTARGGSVSGDGGFVETSSRGLLHVSRAVDASATNGAAGLWLLDPTNIFLVKDGPASIDLTSANSTLDVDVINAALSLGSGVFIDSNSFASGAGNIFQFPDATIIKSGGGLATLTLRATGNITLFGGVYSTGGDGLNLNLLAGTLPATGPWQPGQILISSNIDLGGGAMRAEAGSVKITDKDADNNLISVNTTWMELIARNGGSVEVAAPVTTTGMVSGTDFGVLLRGGSVGVSSTINTLNGGGFGADVSGALTLTPTALLNLDGRFEQYGAGFAQLGADIYTTGDDVLFNGAVTLLDDVYISTTDIGNNAYGNIEFKQSIDSLPFGVIGSPFHLSMNAGMADIAIGGDIGSNFLLDSLDFTARNITVQSVETFGRQTYRTDTLFVQGDTLRTWGFGGDDEGLSGAQIEVVGDFKFGFDGNTVLQNDVAVTTAGDGGMYDLGDYILFTGTVVSEAGQAHTLSADAGDALVVFGDTVGVGAGSDQRLGFLDVIDGSETKLFGDVYTINGMNFWTPVEVNNANTTIHTGDGVAFFGDSIYAGFGFFPFYDGQPTGGEEIDVDVTFAYDGAAWIDLGSARAPFKFAGNIGTNANLDQGIAFSNIMFGSDLGSVPASASFLFGDGVVPGTDLTPLAGSDLSKTFHVWAKDSIVFGQGEKVTSFGSLELLAMGRGDGFPEVDGTPLIQFGDVNVIGDFTARAVNGEIVLRLRDAFGVENADTEQDRIDGMPVDLLDDVGAELIAMGEITLDADTITVDGSGTSSTSYLFANDAGAGILNGQNILAFDGGVGADDFLSILGEADFLYSYDLTIGSLPENPQNLGLAFRDSDRLDPRSQERYLPDLEVLAELNMSPRDVPAEVLLASLDDGITYQINDYSAATGSPSEAGTAVSTITRDRLSRPAITRLTDAYVALLGEKPADGTGERVRAAEVRSAIASAWSSYSGEASGFRQWVAANDPAAAVVIDQMSDVFAAFEAIELPAHEKGIARDRLIDKLMPASMPRDAFEAIFDSSNLGRVAIR
ncbi:MAG: filamentous hemagglutinin N-terminal domain-containing protein [Phycisphaerales bacterium]